MSVFDAGVQPFLFSAVGYEDFATRDSVGPGKKKVMSPRYSAMIRLVRRKARKVWECRTCGKVIQPGDDYYQQSLGLIGKPPDAVFSRFCLECKDSPRTKQLLKKPAGRSR